MEKTAILLISCPDQKGIVASVANFLYKYNANILHADEHQDSEKLLFFLRVEWDLNGFLLTKQQFEEKFLTIVHKFNMTWRITYSFYKPKIAIFVSREEHCLADLLYRHKSEELKCDIKLIISNHSSAEDLSAFYKIPYYKFELNHSNKINVENKILLLLKENSIEMIVLARYMQIFTANFINKFSNPIINIHHSFLPSFIGAKPYHQAHERGVKIIGATAHYITPDLDQGPIIEQDIVRISHRDNIQELIQKGKDIEKIVLSRAVKWHIENRILTYGNKTVVFD